ncbi:mast cell protease 1A-like [Mauremys reevesii]|uniref:mast cell protease 1A-like n=1 Tax=Mauremys reevesii TaxID=260615 RepID=UPI00193F0989|nr:mast cell protease 1A-like [Mauremys reevesii]
MQLKILFLLPMAFLLTPRAQAGEIIGGWEAEPHSRPYMAYLKRKIFKREETCGGFLVREDFVLTAAHCADGDITVLLGAHNVRQKEETQQRVSVLRKIPHPRYNKTSIENDLMLLQLAEPAELSDAISTIPLPQADHTVDPGSVCSVAGWGRTSRHAMRTSSILHEVELEVMSDKTCQEDEKLQYFYKPLRMMCVGDPEEYKASFSGDSGGPLVCDEVAHGIVSFGKKNGSPPRVFTRVSMYVPWIKKTMRGLRSPGSHAESPASLH